MAFDMFSDMSDGALLVRYAAGDRAASQALVRRLTPMAYAVARRMTGSDTDAEDVTQEALLRLWRVAPDWQADQAKVSTWLYRVTYNLCLDRLRKRRDLPLDPELEITAPTAPVEQDMQDRDRASALEQALLALPDRQRQAVILRNLEGLANPEIADIMGLSVEAVESLTARGRRALKAILAPRKQELGYGDD